MGDEQCRAHILALHGLRARLLQELKNSKGHGKVRTQALLQQLRHVQWRLRQITSSPESK